MRSGFEKVRYNINTLTKFKSMLLLCLFLSGCTDRYGTGIIIDPLQPDNVTIIALDIIFSGNNICLINFNEGSYQTINKTEEFTELDTCNEVPDIDFENVTLIAGKIGISSVSDRIADITLTSYRNEQYYDLDILIDKCEECYLATGYCYYWVMYPKLRSDYGVRLLVTEL